MVINNQKAELLCDLSVSIGNRQVALYVEKHEQFTPEDVNLHRLFSRKCFGGIYRDENKDLKSKLYKSS